MCVSAYICVYTYIYMCVCVCVYTYICIYVCVWLLGRMNSVRNNLVTEIFLLQTMVFPASVDWCIILLPCVGSSISHPIHWTKQYLLQALNVGFCVDSEAMSEDELRHNICTASNHPKHPDVGWELSLQQYE